jgi:hypothetical protein
VPGGQERAARARGHEAGWPGDRGAGARQFEFHPIELDLTDDGDEVEIDLVDVVDDTDTEPTAINMMQRRIADLERQLASVRRNARTLEDILLPQTIAS